MIETRKHIEGFPAVPTDAEITQKYLTDIINNGSPELIDEARLLLKAIWCRLIDRRYGTSADNDLMETVAHYLKRVAVEDARISAGTDAWIVTTKG